MGDEPGQPEVLEPDSAGGSGVIAPARMTGATEPAVIDVGSTGLPAKTGSGSVARSGALQAFLQEVGRYPLLSPEEEHTLATRVHDHKDANAARKLAVHNLRLVVKLAYKYRRAWANTLDLIQEGNIGLLEAIKRFDPNRGARFSTYAAYWIRAYLLRFLLEHSRTVRISRTRAGRKLFFRLGRERERLRALGIEPQPKLLAERLGVSEDDYNEVAKHMDQAEVRLDAPLTNDGGVGTVLDLLPGAGETPESAAHRLALADDVSKALAAFKATLTDEREIAIWEEHLLADDPASLATLGARFGVTKQRMGQIVNGVRKRLKVHLLEQLGPEVEFGFAIDR